MEWGQHSLADASRILLRAALADPANQKFIMLSESDIPLYPPTAIWLQLMSEELSRINSCWYGGWVSYKFTPVCCQTP